MRVREQAGERGKGEQDEHRAKLQTVIAQLISNADKMSEIISGLCFEP